MSSFKQCIINGVKEGLISESNAERLYKNLDEVKAFAPFDAVVTMGCGDACPWMPAKQFMDWQIPAPKTMEPKEFNEVRDFIKTKVEELLNIL